ncbi:MAG: hypothetical protein C0432_04200 [Candidatus Puniceispirillum sp.]|nr:hypothetical protein [Candidatus Pelagibacter sp.]MBA4283477.1 hypothetical protein [Candidatus Puniceispirillum sp.]
MKTVLYTLLLTAHFAFSSDINIYEEAKKLNTSDQTAYYEDPEFKEFDQIIPSHISIAVEKLCLHIDRRGLTEDQMNNIVIQRNFLSLKGITEFDNSFLEKLESLDSRLKNSRTAEMLSLCHRVWGNQEVSNNYLRIHAERERAEKELEQTKLISITEKLVEMFGNKITREYVVEMRGLYPQSYLATYWPDIIL